eukprot:TRINITY_DN7452_c0_g1_i1.p1 TRINITY_DN7452_c0_g1~~TRINITY_DN7452_c0_g1_i1.p1  ORF type:complete len:270 (+),score=50.87 TRINITY_DN7452_c0_g1_i1:379-1188(+)
MEEEEGFEEFQEGDEAIAQALQEQAGTDLHLMELAKSQRMTTDARKAIFCIIMGSEDCQAAQQSLLQLPIKKDQQREISRIVIDCCLQERTFNPYYAHLAAGLCGANSKHLASLQFGFWDKLAEIQSQDENCKHKDLETQIRIVSNLGNFLAWIVILLAKKENKIVLRRFVRKKEMWTQFNQRELMFWNIFFQKLLMWGKQVQGGIGVRELFEDCKEDLILREGLLFYLSKQFRKWLKDGLKNELRDGQLEQLKQNWKIAVGTLSTEEF